jgi:hypothetical protein
MFYSRQHKSKPDTQWSADEKTEYKRKEDSFYSAEQVQQRKNIEEQLDTSRNRNDPSFLRQKLVTQELRRLQLEAGYQHENT